MLTVAVDQPDVPAGWAAEPKWDGFRALLSVETGGVVPRSRRGTEMAASFPEIVAGAAQLPDATALDGELVVWFVAFDLLRLSGTDTTGWPYARRRAALESVFAARRLIAPWTLCPSTTVPQTVGEWLTWASVGMEGVVFKRLDDVYRPSVRGWRKYKVRETSEAIIGALTGPPTAPRTLLLGRYDDEGRFQYVGRTTTRARQAGAAVAGLLAAGRGGHPWTGWSFSAGWGSREHLDVTLVEPHLVVEVGVDVARDASGRWRHPARWHRARPDLSPADVPRLTAPPH
ncbi:ATP-dependent DNA ligase [Streptomyces sp. NRRL WC-3723]|nr:ATP-dependent DNA ligase [Streptomyces sp. NRRL WC-3723]